ncbi:MAG: hypothetical protein WAU70_08340 [Flavobacteriales bacterium]
MNDLDLMRSLRRLRRTVDMLQADLRRDHLNKELLTEIEKHMDHGIASEPRCAGLSVRVDAVRESTLTPRRELCSDTIKACEQLKVAIDGLLNVLA